MFEGQVHGPETVLKRGNEIYTTIHGGEVIKITDEHITHVAKFGKPCGKCKMICHYHIFFVKMNKLTFSH